MASMKEASRGEFDSRNTMEDLKFGVLQRIADATEKMALNYRDLIRERDQFKVSKDYWMNRHTDLEKANRALRGQITKLKNKAKKEAA